MKTGAAVFCASVLAVTSALADFAISIDPAKTPIRDATKTPCASLIGYAGSMNSEKMGHIYDCDAYWFWTNRYETAAVMKEAGAYNQRLWSANDWFARRNGGKGKRPASDPKAAFEFWKANGMKVLLDLECWSEPGYTNCLEFVKWIVDNGYQKQVAGFELGNESFFAESYPEQAPRLTRLVNEMWKIWPKVPIAICLAELYEQNPDLVHVRERLLAEGKIEANGYFSASEHNQRTTQFVIGMSNCLDKISHVVYHAYGAETPYSCSYYGFQRFRNYLRTMPELKGKKMLLTEVRPRSDEDNRCQRIFRESLIMGHYALTAICQPDFDGFNHHELHAQSGGIYTTDGKVWAIQWRDGYDWGGQSFRDRAPYDRPRMEVGSQGVVYRIFVEALRDFPILMSHGTSQETDTEDTFFTSARVTDQVYARRNALKEGRKPFLGLFGGVPEVEGEVEWVASLDKPGKHARHLCLLMVNTKNVEMTCTVGVKGMQLAAPVYVAVSCPAEHVDDRAVPGEGHWWRQVAWEDTQCGWPQWRQWERKGNRWFPKPETVHPKSDELTVKIAPHTAQSVVFPMRPWGK